MMLAAHQLVRHRDADDVADAGVAAQVQRAELLDVTDQTDDRAGHAPADECLAAGRGDQVDDCVNVTLGGLGGHHHHHCVILLVPS